MSQNGIVLPTTGTVSGLQMAQDTNNALQDLASLFSGPAAPGGIVPYQFWADTASGLLKMRNAANTAWISLLSLSTGIPVDNANNALKFVYSGADGSGANIIPIPAGTTNIGLAHSGKDLLVVSAGATLALTNPAGSNGIRCRIWPYNYATNIVAPGGTANLLGEDGSVLAGPGATYALPISGYASHYEVCSLDGNSYVLVTHGRKIINNAVNGNEAVALGQVRGHASLANNAGQTFAVGTTKATLNSVLAAGGGCSADSTNSRIVVNDAGDYIINAFITGTGTIGSTQVTLQLYVNGAPVPWFLAIASSTTSGEQLAVSFNTVYPLPAGAVLELYVSASTNSFSTNGTGNIGLSIVRAISA